MAEVRLSIAVMHLPSDPKRRAMVSDLQRRLGGLSTIRAETISFEVVSDVGHEGVWPTARRAWQQYRGNPTHHLVMQDDALPCRNFIASAKAALLVAPILPVSFFANRKVISAASARGDSWARIDDGTWGVALALPAHQVSDMLTWVRDNVRPDYQHDDRRILLWLRSKKMGVYCTVPSLVEHGAPNDSTLGHNNKNQVARLFIGTDQSGTSIDWTRGVERPLRDAGAVHWRDIESEALL